MADALSWVTAHLEPEAVQAVLDGATMGTSQRAERENPAIIKSDQQLEQEVQVAALVSPSRNACHQLGSSSKRGSQAGCSSAMARV